MDPSLFIPLINHKIFPQIIRRCFRFGVPEYEEKPSLDDDEKKPFSISNNSSVVKKHLLLDNKQGLMLKKQRLILEQTLVL